MAEWRGRGAQEGKQAPLAGIVVACRARMCRVGPLPAWMRLAGTPTRAGGLGAADSVVGRRRGLASRAPHILPYFLYATAVHCGSFANYPAVLGTAFRKAPSQEQANQSAKIVFRLAAGIAKTATASLLQHVTPRRLLVRGVRAGTLLVLTPPPRPRGAGGGGDGGVFPNPHPSTMAEPPRRGTGRCGGGVGASRRWRAGAADPRGARPPPPAAAVAGHSGAPPPPRAAPDDSWRIPLSIGWPRPI